jgi:hypothetical protein
VKPAIAPQGNAVLRYMNEEFVPPANRRVGATGPTLALYELGDGRILWQQGLYEITTESNGPDGFLVKEEWHKLWEAWLPNLKYETLARRSLDDASLLYRTSAKIAVDPRNYNAARTLVVMSDGAVHRLPLQTNWPLFALCQTILALPLILLWAMLRWRRNRRLRLASVTP